MLFRSTVAYNGAQTAGDLNVVIVGWNDTTSSITSVRDSLGNVYQVAAPTKRGNALSQAMFYAANVKAAAAGANKVTVQFNAAATFVDVRILEYKGITATSPLDAHASGAGNASTASSGWATTTASGELVVAGGTTSWAFDSAGQGYTTRIITQPDTDIAEDSLTGAAGTYSATGPVSGGGNWVMQMATFKHK